MSDDTTKTISIKSESYQNGFIFTSTIPSDEVTPVGEYKLTFGHADLTETNYKTINIKVVARNVNSSSLELVWTDGLRYNGSEQTVTIENLPVYLEVVSYDGNTETYPNGTIAPNESIPQAEIYTATATLKVKDDMTDKYILTGDGVIGGICEITHNWTIAKGIIAVPTLTNDDMESYTYTPGTSRTATIKEAKRTELTNKNIIPVFEPTTAVNAGNYQVSILFKYTNDADKAYYDLMGDDHNQIGSVEVTWKINPFTINTSNLSLKIKDTDDNFNISNATAYTDSSFTYDGNEKEVAFDTSSLQSLGYTIHFYYPGFVEGEMTSKKLVTTTSGTFKATDVGTYSVTISFTLWNDTEENRLNYVISNPTITLTWKINPKPLTITVKDRIGTDAMTYGDTVSYSASDVVATGFAGNETLESLGSLNFVYSTEENGTYTSTLPKNAGTYYVKVANCVSNKYNITYTTGTLEIKKADLIVTPVNTSFAYGGVYGTGDVTITGYKYDDKNALQQQINYTLTIKIGKIVDENFVEYSGKMVVGEYVYRVSGLDNLSNYTPIYVDSTMIIKPSPLSITLKAKTGDNALTYGDTIQYSASDIGVDGLKYSDSLESLGNINIVYASSQTGTFDVTPKNVGTYYAKLSEFESNESNINYNITYNVSELEIKKAILTVKIKDMESEYTTYYSPEESVEGFKYDDDRESSGFSYEGNYEDWFYNKDDSTQKAPKTRYYVDAGEYIFIPKFRTMTNYEVELTYGTRGTYIIKPKEIKIKAHPELEVHSGDELTASNVRYYEVDNDYIIEWTNSSYKQIDNEARITGTLSFTTNYTKGDPVGNYTIKAQGLTCGSSNYTIVYLETTFEVFK